MRVKNHTTHLQSNKMKHKEVSHNYSYFIPQQNIYTTLVTMIWNNNAPILHTCSFKHMMFNPATSFNQPHLYCKWSKKSPSLRGHDNVCTGAKDCGWGFETCPSTNAPTPSPITASTPSSGNGGGGKAAAIVYFLYYHYGVLLILLNYYFIFHIH
jgi:hypothetical protein